MRDPFASGIVSWRKEGFILPINAWLLERFRGFVEAVLAPQHLAQQVLLNREPVAGLLADHHACRADHATRIWTLAMFQCWYDLYFGKGSLPEVT